MRVAGLLCLLGGVLLTLCTFALPLAEIPLPELAQAEARPAPLPFTLPLEYTQLVIRASDETGWPVWLLSRTFWWESGWNPNFNRDHHRMNTNGSFDEGVAGINTFSRRWLAMRYNGGKDFDPYDPWQAIPVAARYLADLQATTGSWRGAVVAYAGHRSALHTDAIIGAR